MSGRKGHVDRPLSLLLAILIIGGGMIFSSAAFGLLARGTIGMTSVVFGHLVLGIGGGIIGMLIMITVDYHVLQKWAPYIFSTALILTALVFVPHLGMTHGGGRRWIGVAGVSLQPSEILKIAV